MLIKFKIEKQTIRATNYNMVVSDSVNFVSASFDFDDEWSEYVKTVTFTNTKTHVSKSILLDSALTCHIPWEVLDEEGKLNVYAEGFYNGSVATTATMRAPLSIKDSGRGNCGYPSPTPDVYQQILERLNHIQKILLSKEDVTDLVDTKLENYLAKDNIDEYEPIESLNPATKGYVDHTVENHNLLSHAYSLEEHLIGTWVDGKPLYQKSIDCGVLDSGAITIPHGITDFNQLIYLGNPIVNDTEFTILSFVNENGDHETVSFTIDNENIIIHSSSPTSTSVPIMVTLQYTKIEKEES